MKYWHDKKYKHDKKAIVVRNLHIIEWEEVVFSMEIETIFLDLSFVSV